VRLSSFLATQIDKIMNDLQPTENENAEATKNLLNLLKAKDMEQFISHSLFNFLTPLG
jgi:hypothetical protein